MIYLFVLLHRLIKSKCIESLFLRSSSHAMYIVWVFKCPSDAICKGMNISGRTQHASFIVINEFH